MMTYSAHITHDQWQGLPVLRLSCGNAKLTVSTFGAQPLSWIPADGCERLYLSPTAPGDGTQPIRGGIPIIFPQWADLGPNTRHGFARRLPWQMMQQRTGADYALALWRLEAAALPEPFRNELPGQWWAEVTVVLEPWRLDVELAVGNEGAEPLTFTGGLHTYLATDDVEASHLAGLADCCYRDANDSWAERRDLAKQFTVAAPINRVYPAPTRPLYWQTPRHATTIEQVGFADIVVWNPWEGHGLSDLPANGFRRFLCVEAAQLSTPITLAPGQEWAGRQTFTAIPQPGAPLPPLASTTGARHER